MLGSIWPLCGNKLAFSLLLLLESLQHLCWVLRTCYVWFEVQVMAPPSYTVDCQAVLDWYPVHVSSQCSPPWQASFQACLQSRLSHGLQTSATQRPPVDSTQLIVLPPRSHVWK
jgi:hypothetical protein